MLLLLPPSKTKLDGGTGEPLRLDALSYPSLTGPRRAVLSALRTVSRSVRASSAALGLGPTQGDEVLRNRAVRTSPTMPAIQRYTGVLYEPLAALTDAELAFAAEHVAIASALFGLVGAADPIPAYRLSHDSRLPGPTLRRHWAPPVSAVLDGLGGGDGLVLDLRSGSYVALGPAPSATTVRVVSEAADGRRIALSYFNKHGKGVLTRAIISAGVDHDSVDSLLRWAAGAGIRLEPGRPGELDLVV